MCMKRVEVNGHPILLANVDGTIYATDDTCTHEGITLSLFFQWLPARRRGQVPAPQQPLQSEDR